MAYASKIIRRFGGTRAMASALNIPPSTVQSWKDTGLIPAKHQQAVLDKGRDLEKPITPDDFFDVPPSSESQQAAA